LTEAVDQLADVVQVLTEADTIRPPARGISTPDQG
jgi:hypothetical protein